MRVLTLFLVFKLISIKNRLIRIRVIFLINLKVRFIYLLIFKKVIIWSLIFSFLLLFLKLNLIFLELSFIFLFFLRTKIIKILIRFLINWLNRFFLWWLFDIWKILAGLTFMWKIVNIKIILNFIRVLSLRFVFFRLFEYFLKTFIWI